MARRHHDAKGRREHDFHHRPTCLKPLDMGGTSKPSESHLRRPSPPEAQMNPPDQEQCCSTLKVSSSSSSSSFIPQWIPCDIDTICSRLHPSLSTGRSSFKHARTTTANQALHAIVVNFAHHPSLESTEHQKTDELEKKGKEKKRLTLPCSTTLLIPPLSPSSYVARLVGPWCGRSSHTYVPAFFSPQVSESLSVLHW